jgi:hypothetical protein
MSIPALLSILHRRPSTIALTVLLALSVLAIVSSPQSYRAVLRFYKRLGASHVWG